MVRKMVCRIFVFFLALLALVNVSFSFEDLNGRHFLQLGEKVEAVGAWEEILNVSGLGLKYVEINPAQPYYNNTTFNVITDFTHYEYRADITYLSGASAPPKAEKRDRYNNVISGFGSETIYYTNESQGNVFAWGEGSEYSVKVYRRQLNNIHVITVTSPLQNETLSELKTCTPSMKVSDPNGDTLICKYYIDSVEKEPKTISNTATAQVVNFSALDITNLSEGNHQLKFEVKDPYSDPVTRTVDIIVDKFPPTLGQFTYSSDYRTINVSGSATDSVTEAGALQYRYRIGDKDSDWITANSWNSGGSLSPNTKYNVKLEVMDKGGNIAKKEQFVYTIPQTPQVSVSNIKENSMDINLIDSNPSPIKYEIKVGSSYVNAIGALTSSSQLVEPTNKKITVTGLLPNTQYSIQVKAKNVAENDGAINCGEESKISSIAATTLAQPPANIRTESNLDSIIISWDAVSNAKGYEISVDGDDAKCTNVGTSTTYTHSSLMPDSYHHYKVRTINMEGAAGPWSSEIIASTLPNPPDAPTITSAKTTYSAITVNWSAVAGATGYDIQIDDDTNSKDVGLETTYTHEGLTPGSAHKYRVRAKIKRGEKVVEGKWSELMEVSTPPLPPEVPSDFKGVATKNDITLTWSESKWAQGYELEINGKRYDMGKETSYVYDGRVASSNHVFRVRAYNRNGEAMVYSQWSSQQEITTWPEVPSAPTNIMATSEKDSITVTWYSSPFAGSYYIEIDGNEKNIQNVTDLSYTHKNLIAGTKHSYRLRANNITGNGEWSNPIEISTLPEETATTTSGAISLTNITAVVTNKSVTIAWQAAKAKVQYQVEVDGKIFDNGKETVYNHTGLKPQSFHTYRVRTVDTDGNGQWCAILALSTLPDLPDAPKNITATAFDTQIELSWVKQDGVSYEIEADGEIVPGYVTSGEYPHTDLKPGTTHTYRVRGRNAAGGATAWSDSVTKSTTSPSYEVECKKDTAFNFSLLASNVDYFGGMGFVVKYNPEQLEVQDLCDFTANNDTSSGKIPGTNLTVTYTSGKIVFSVDESIAPGANWSGEISTIIFKSKIDGKAGINYSIE